MRTALAVAVLIGGLMLNGCAGASGGGPDIKQGSLEQTKIELRAIDAVGDERPAGARYIPDERTVYITLYVINNPITDQEINDAQAAAERELDGLHMRVVIELEHGDVPREH